MAEYYQNYVTVALFVGLAALLFGAMLGVARLLQPRRQTDEKLSTYECGVDPVEGDWTQGHIRYYVFALLFLVFDLEAAFIFPWAVVMGNFGAAVLVEMVVFIGILAAALLYAYRKGLLRWA